MSINAGRMADLSYPPLTREIEATFQDSRFEEGWIAAGQSVFRHGSDPSQARWSRGKWVNATLDEFEYSAEAIKFCALLDATLHALESSKNGQPTGVWNTAAWRCTLTARAPVAVYFGYAAPLIFDSSVAKVYRGSGDLSPDRCVPGGAVQLLISGDAFDRFHWSHPERLQSTRLPS